MAIRRNIYLIDPKFQLRFSLFMASLVFVPSLLYPYTIYSLINKLVTQLDSPELTRSLEMNQNNLILLLVLWQLAFTALVFIIGIFQSHKVAGPMYKLKKFLHDIIEGHPPGHLFFRKGDNFQEVADDFNAAIAKIQGGFQQDTKVMKQASELLAAVQSTLPPDQQSKAHQLSVELMAIYEKHQAT